MFTWTPAVTFICMPSVSCPNQSGWRMRVRWSFTSASNQLNAIDVHIINFLNYCTPYIKAYMIINTMFKITHSLRNIYTGLCWQTLPLFPRPIIIIIVVLRGLKLEEGQSQDDNYSQVISYCEKDTDINCRSTAARIVKGGLGSCGSKLARCFWTLKVTRWDTLIF